MPEGARIAAAQRGDRVAFLAFWHRKQMRLCLARILLFLGFDRADRIVDDVAQPREIVVSSTREYFRQSRRRGIGAQRVDFFLRPVQERRMRGVDAAVDDGKGDAAGVDLEHPLGRVRFDGGPGFEQGLLRRPVQADEENPLRYLVLVVRRRLAVPQQALGTVVDVTQDGDRLQGRAAVCVRAQSIGQRAQRVDGLFRAGSHEVVDEAHESDIATELGVFSLGFSA